MSFFAAMMLVALLIDGAVGWPDALFRRIGHPVTWIGAAIAAFEGRTNRGGKMVRRVAGAVLVAVLVVGVGAVTGLVQAALPAGWVGIAMGGLLAWPLVASRSMYLHVRAVAQPLIAGDLEAARGAVAMIVGRDPARLDGPGVARASLESLAENTSDGIIAPLFWGAVAGLPGIAIYKAINTADSMIGHRSERYEDFGKAAALLDDLVNLAPARLTGALFALCSGRAMGRALALMWREAGQHRSPNAGWPEAAMAAGLGLRLSGPRAYGGGLSDEPWVNGAAPDPAPRDIARGLALYLRVMVVSGVLLGALALL